MYKRNVKPLEEFLSSYPPQEGIISTADTASSITRARKSPEQSIRGQTLLEQPLLSRCLVVGQIWKSKQNGMVYDPEGVAPCLCVGNHSGVEPKIIEYEY